MINKDELKKSLTIEQVYELVAELGGEPKPIKDNYFVARTICHNPAGQGSYKLYYYDNDGEGIFHCYTDCPEGSFDIFELVKKQKTIADGVEWPLPRAISYVAYYFGYDTDSFEENNVTELPDWKILNKYLESNKDVAKQIVELKVYDSNVLKFFPTPRILPWEQEGISQTVMQHRGIAYNPTNQSVLIPHYDINNNLIGIRERTLIQEKEQNGKYRPAIINGIMYNHPLSFNLYNLNNSKNNIKTMQKAIIGEGEKFCLTYASYFGEENDITVACCGSSLISYQVQLLLSFGVREIIVAFDKQFQEIGDFEFKKWVKKLKDINKKYSSYVTISFMFDKYNLLGYKDSPIDKGKNVFLELYNRRFTI